MGGSRWSGGGVFGTRRAISAASSVFFFTISGLGLGGGGGGAAAAERFSAKPGFAASYARPAAMNLRESSGVVRFRCGARGRERTPQNNCSE